MSLIDNLPKIKGKVKRYIKSNINIPLKKKYEPSGLEKIEKKERIFISGQISSFPFDGMMDKFCLASIKLINQGYETINPLDIEGWEDTLRWVEYMDLCIPELMRCDAIFMLKDWGSSKKSRIEYAIAKEMGLKILSSGTGDYKGGE